LDKFFTLQIFPKLVKEGNEEKTKILIENGREDGLLKLLF